MKNILLALAVLSISASINAAPSGLEIMKKVETREDGDDSKSAITMSLISKSGKTKVRELNWWRRDQGDDAKHLIKFSAPKTLKNTGLLVFSYAKKSDRQWLFLPNAANPEPREIAAQNRDDSFIGSEFFYVDFEKVRAADFSHSILKAQSKGHLTAVESTPKEKDYPYSKIIFYVNTKTDIPETIEFFKKGKKLKTLTSGDIKKVEGILTIMTATMKNHRNGRSSILKVNKIKYNIGLKDSLFTKTKLKKSL